GADVLPTLILTGLGLGLAFVPVIGLGTGDAEERDGGLASGLMTTAQQIGGAIGIAALITIATDHTTSALHAGAPLASAMTDGFQAAFHIEAGIIGAAALLALVLLRRRETLELEPIGAPSEIERSQNRACCRDFSREAGATGLEPATSGVTGRRSNQ